MIFADFGNPAVPELYALYIKKHSPLIYPKLSDLFAPHLIFVQRMPYQTLPARQNVCGIGVLHKYLQYFR